MADALPGLGIVAAVLGVVITMGALGGPKEEIGHKVAAALVGTFLGILLCYGIFGPLAAAMGKNRLTRRRTIFGFLRMAALAFIKGLSPIMAVELARRAIPDDGAPDLPGNGRRPAAAAARSPEGGITMRLNAEAAATPTRRRGRSSSSSRKKAGHGGHHGGAWKVAYADFVTAMMALFIVLWLMSADEKVKEAISAFFNNPTGPGKRPERPRRARAMRSSLPKEDMAKLREKMQQALKTMPNFRDMKDHVEMTITVDGLRIELLETEAGMFFESGRPLPPTPAPSC